MAAFTEIPSEEFHDVRINASGDRIIRGGYGDGGCDADEKSSAVESKTESELKPGSEFKPDSEYDMQNLEAMFKKLNPLAKEFFPSYYNQKSNENGKFNQLLSAGDAVIEKKQSGDEFYSDNKKQGNNGRRRNHYAHGRRRLTGRASKAQREESIKRTIYVSEIDLIVMEENLAELFNQCGQVVDCRICGDPHSVLRFAFVEFSDEQGAREALKLDGTMLGYYPVRVLPSKTAIVPVNPTFLPRSEDEWDMCTRTIYCTNVDKKVSQADVKNFFESACGEVTRLRLLGDQLHSTRIAFVEFATAEHALLALNCTGMVLGTQPIRVSPSKTPVRSRITHPSSTDPKTESA